MKPSRFAALLAVLAAGSAGGTIGLSANAWAEETGTTLSQPELAADAGAMEETAPAAPVSQEIISSALVQTLRMVVFDDIVQTLVNAQNKRNENITQAEIDRLDQQWRAEVEDAQKPLIASTVSNPLSTYLLRMQARSAGLYTEIIVTDAKGLNVGQSSVTSDYWQGDEAKFQKTYPVGGMEVFIDDAEWNDETRTWRAQVNLTVPDVYTYEPIGAATFEINLTELARREGIEIAALNVN